MRISASSTLLFAYNLDEVLNIANQLGYDGVEIWHFHLIKNNEVSKCLEFSALARNLGLDISFHALSWDLNFTSKLKNIREASLRMLEKSIDVAEALRANPVVIHPGRITIPGDSLEDYWIHLIEGVERLSSYAKQRGLDIALEVMEHEKNEFFISPEDANRILKNISAENLGITFDAAHVPLEIDPMDYLRRMHKIIHIHLSDLTPQKRHIALNTGDRDFTALLDYIQKHLQTAVAIEGMEYERSEWLAQHNIREIRHLIQNSSTRKSVKT